MFSKVAYITFVLINVSIWSCQGQIGGSISTSSGGGTSAQVSAGHAIGTPNHNLAGSVFASGPVGGGPITTGGGLNYNL